MSLSRLILVIIKIPKMVFIILIYCNGMFRIWLMTVVKTFFSIYTSKVYEKHRKISVPDSVEHPRHSIMFGFFFKH